MSNSNIVSGFVKTLNRHGFAFQYAALAEAQKAFDKVHGQFAFEAAEVPVRAQGGETKIDFVLRHAIRPIAMICECKRVNPSIANWCFLKAPLVHREWHDSSLILDLIQHRPASSILGVSPYRVAADRTAYQICIELRTHPVPEGKQTATSKEGAGGRADFEKAVRQVLLGTNGLLNLFLSRNDLGSSSPASKLLLLPVVITTAELWVSEIDLNETDLLTGEFPVGKAELKRAEWVIYQEHMAPTLKFDTAERSSSADLPRVLETEFIRSILVVSACHLRTFLQWASAIALSLT